MDSDKDFKGDFIRYLRKLAPLHGDADFVDRIPLIFYNQVTQVGAITLNKSVFSYRPSFKLEDSNIRDVIFSHGHVINFELNDSRGPCINTEVEYAAQNPHRIRSLELLEEMLGKNIYRDNDNRSINFTNTLGKPSRIDGRSHITIVSPIELSASKEHSTLDHWCSFWTSVGKPLYVAINAAYR